MGYDITKNFQSVNKTGPVKYSPRGQSAPVFDRTPPHCAESEKGLLGALLRDNSAISESQTVVKADHFYSHANRFVFESIASLFDMGRPADVVTVADDLKKKNQIEEIGGYAYLAELFDSAATSANAGYYAKIVRDKGELRALIATGSEIVAEAYAAAGEADEIIGQALAKMMDRANPLQNSNCQPIAVAINRSYDRIDKRQRGQMDTGIPSGFTDFDTLTAGFHPGEMGVIGARPSIGKTAFAVNLARNQAVDHGYRVLFFSLEQSSLELADRFIAAQAMLDQKKLRSSQLSSEDMDVVFKAGDKLKKAKLHIDDSADTTMLRIAARARTIKQTTGLDIIYIDYLQLIAPEDRRSPRQEQVAQISRRIKVLARELGIPIITLAQLNRNSEEREGNLPRMSDFRESGGIENDADTVMLLHRPERNNPGEREGEVDVIVCKQRNGPIGNITLAFNKALARFSNMAFKSPHDRF